MKYQIICQNQSPTFISFMLSLTFFQFIILKMPKTVDNYIIQKQLFKDSFQIVYILSQHKVLKKPFTLKRIEKAADECHSKQQEKRKIKLSFVYSCLQNQIQILRQLKSQKIIKCLKLLKAKNAIYAVYDQHPEKSLQKIMQTQYLTFQKKQNILNEILTFIKQVHQHNIAIGNIQPSNLYFTSDYKIQTSNFLIAKKLNQSEAQQQIQSAFLDSKCEYYAPEILNTGILSKAADIYSFGIIMKNLKLQKHEHQFLTPIKLTFENISQTSQRMINEDPLSRPCIIEVEKSFSLNRSRNKSTCGSNASRDNQEKMADIRGLQSYKSEATLKFLNFNQVLQSSTLRASNNKRSFITKRQSLNPDVLESSRKFNLKDKQSFDSISVQSSHYINNTNLQVPQIKKSREQLSSKSGSSSNNKESLSKTSNKQKIVSLMLTRNLVSFLIEMTLFTYQQNSNKNLSFLLIQQALRYTNNLLKTIDFLIKEQNITEITDFYNECKTQKKNITEISTSIRTSFGNKNCSNEVHDIFLVDELKKFGKYILNLYSSTYSIHSRTSQVSDSLSRARQLNQLQKQKQNQQKLFKTLLLLKRLEYGNYYEFFKAKIHHPSKKFWNQHYFEFQKTFGGKYFMIQIKDLITKK